MGRPKKNPELSTEKPDNSRREKRLTNKAAWGPEPTWDRHYLDEQSYRVDIGFALNWYSVNATAADRQKWTLAYLYEKVPTDVLNYLEKVHDGYFTTIGSLARCAMRGAHLTEAHLDFIIKRAKTLAREKKQEVEIKRLNKETTKRLVELPKEDPVVTKLIMSVEDALQTKRGEIKLDYQDLLLDLGANVQQATAVAKFYARFYFDVDQMITGEADDDLKEAYEHITHSRLEHLHDFLSGVITGHLLVKDTQPKKPRKPRKKKAKSAEKILKRFKYCPSIPELNIQSIDPSRILGAQELWVFNTKYRTLGLFKAATEEGFTVSGSSIRNFDEEVSISKKLRKPETVLPGLITMGKVALRHLMDDIKSKPQVLRSSIGPAVVLLRIS